MKKIPTLFKRLYFEDGSFLLTQEVTEGMEWVLSRRKKEQGIATMPNEARNRLRARSPANRILTP